MSTEQVSTSSTSVVLLSLCHKYVDFHIKDSAKKHKSYLQDTPHFLRVVEEVNKGSKLPKNTILATIDVIGAYQNIPQEDGIKCLKEELDDRKNPSIPSEFLTKLMELLITNNLFEFNEDIFRQLIGMAMGSAAAPSYCDIYLGRRIDPKLEEMVKNGQNGLKWSKMVPNGPKW